MEPSGAGGLLFVDFTLACCRGRGLGLGDDLMGEGDEWDPGEEGLAHAVVVLWVVVEQRQHCLSRQHWFEAVICGPAGIGKVALVHGNLVTLLRRPCLWRLQHALRTSVSTSV